MEEISIKTLKQQLMTTISEIDKSKLTIYDLKALAETVGVISNIKETEVDYLDALMKTASGGFGPSPKIISELKGDAK